jgi:hypothetical protein
MMLTSKLNSSRSFFFSVIALAAATGCGGSSSSPEMSSNDAGGGSDSATHADTGTTGDGGGGSIAGSLAISVTVLQNTGVTGVNNPFNACSARIEVPGNSKLFLETKTDMTGVATFMVDPAQGPYDVTVANAGVGAASILGVTASIPGNVVLYSVTVPPTPTNLTATGMISGKQALTNQVQLDAWDWQTVSTAAATYSTSFSYTAGLATESPLPVAAIEENDAGIVVNGLLTTAIMRPSSGGAMINVAFDMASPMAPTTGTVNVVWPASGFNAGSAVKQIANADPSAGTASADMYLGNGLIEQTIATEPGAGMYCGRVDVTLPASNMSTMTIQSYGGNLMPSLVTGAWTSTAVGATMATAADFETYLYLSGSQLAGGTVTLPAIRTEGITFTGSAMTLDAAQFAIDSDYTNASIALTDDDASTITTLWTVYSLSGKVATRGLPHLPTAVKLMDIAGDTSALSLVIQAQNYVTGVQPWEAIAQQLAIETNTFADVVIPTPGTY